MDVDIESTEPLQFADASPVRAASAVVPFGDGFLVAQDDTTHAAWVRDGGATAVRLFDPVEGHDTFEKSTGTKELKPDLEAAVVLPDGGVLFLGSGSTDRRMRSALVRLEGDEPQVTVADLTSLYAVIARTLEVDGDELNLEGACVLGEILRWFHRGVPSAGVPSASVDLDLAQLLAAATGEGDASAVTVGDPHRYDLGEVEGVGLAVTDAVLLAGSTILMSAAAEDTPNAQDDGPVVGAALVRLEDHEVVGHAELPDIEGGVCKVEGLMILDSDEGGAHVLGVVDADDPHEPSLGVRLGVRW